MVTTNLKPATAISTTYLSIITLNVNGLNAPIKRHRVIEWIKKQDPYICCLQETHLKSKDIHRLKVKRWKKIFHAKNKEKRAGVSTSIRLNAPIKRHRVIEWVKRQDPSLCCLQETELKPKDMYRLKVKGWKNIFQANNSEKKAGVAVLI